MKKLSLLPGVLIAFLIFLTGFKKNTHSAFLSKKPVNAISGVSSFRELPEIVISDITVIQSDKGQTPAEVMVCLSQESKEAVTVEYRTKNGTAIAGTDYVATSGSIRFEPGEIAKWITVPIIGEVAADPDEDAHPATNLQLALELINAVGALIKDPSALISIVKNAALLFPPVAGARSAYEVIFEYHGYTSLGPELRDCQIRNGKVNLHGILEGNEKVGPYDDVDYTGKLWLDINMDICSVERDDTKDPPDQYCTLRVVGWGYVTTDLKLDADGRVAWIKIDGDTSQFYRNVVGDCFSQRQGERENVPNNSIASIFNGLDLHEVLVDSTAVVALGQERPHLRTLRKGDYSKTYPGNNVITVRVIRKLR